MADGQQTSSTVNGRIFVSVASFCDPHLEFTLDSLFAEAVHPQRVFVGLVNQSISDDRAWLEQKSYARQVRYLYVNAVDSRGVCWARSLAFSLYRDEPFFLQIDSHTWFKPGWDNILENRLVEFEQLYSKPVISTYPPGFEFDESGQPVDSLKLSTRVMVLRVHPESALSDQDPVLRFTTDWLSGPNHEKGYHVAGGFLFARGRFIREVPYDASLYFHGEEQSLAIRAWTRGWDILHPRMCDIPLLHLYKTRGKTHEGQHWRDDLEKRRTESFSELKSRARERLKQVVYDPQPGDPYGLGTERDLSSFAAFSGIDYPGHRVFRESAQERAKPEASFLQAGLGRAATQTRYGEMTVFSNDRFISQSLHVYGQWGQTEIDALSKWLSPGDWAVDVGSYIGHTCLALAERVGPTGRVFAFEPHPQIYALLEENIGRSSLASQIVRLHDYGLGHLAGPKRMAALPAARAQNIGLMSTGDNGEHAVRVIRLDDLALERCDVIKIDVAGNEVAVLEGAIETVRRYRPVILVEFNAAGAPAIKSWVSSLQNYHLSELRYPAFEPANWRGEVRDVFPGVTLNNALLIPAEKMSAAGSSA